MSVVVVSLHERGAPLELLEQVAVADRDLPKALQQLCDSPHLSEAVILSTCMRTEVYAVLERFHDGIADIQRFFEDRVASTALTTNLLADRLVVEYDESAAQHLFDVAAGIDSAVLGESEILRQVRASAELAHKERASGPVLAGLFRHALEVGKRSRTETAIARGVTSLSHIAVAIAAEQTLGSLSHKRVVVVGSGEMGEGITEAFARRDDRPEIVVAARNNTKATTFSKRVGARVASIIDMHDEIAQSDIVVTATTADGVLLALDEIASIMATRSDRPLIIIDVAMPRDVDPQVGDLDGVTLIDVADLGAYAEREIASRAGEVDSVKAIIAEELERYHVNARARTVAPVVASLRAKAEALRLEELARHQAKLRSLSDEEREVVEAFSRGLVAKLLHEPTVQLKRDGGSPRGERLSEALRTLFDL